MVLFLLCPCHPLPPPVNATHRHAKPKNPIKKTPISTLCKIAAEPTPKSLYPNLAHCKPPRNPSPKTKALQRAKLPTPKEVEALKKSIYRLKKLIIISKTEHLANWSNHEKELLQKLNGSWACRNFRPQQSPSRCQSLVVRLETQ